MIQENIDITRFTTFGIPVKTRYFAEYASERELLKISRSPEFLNNEVLQIGGGSNLLFLSDFDGLVLHSTVRGMVRYEKNDETVYAIAGAGEKWTDFVDWTIEQGLSGLENLAGIPGEVGAAPVQNVGAYGVEAGDCIYSVECFDLFARKTRVFKADECQFGYRDSFFKHAGKGRYVVLRVSFRLNKDGKAHNLEYGPLREFAEALGREPSPREVADEIIKIRNSKLPDPAIIGSAGSFFKNPVIPNGYLREIYELTGERLTGHPVGEHCTKVSAAWLIDHAGMKGRRVGGAQVYEKQPLVIVNNGNATGEDVRLLAQQVSDAVRRKYMISLTPEVNYIDSHVTVKVLGSGTSKGVPEVGCMCPVCQSPFRKDKRQRASVLVRTMGLTILIDPSPDFRQQALQAELYNIDAVLITHSHYDHVGGLDDLRPFCMGRNLPLYVREDVDRDLHTHFDYCFREHPYPGVPTFDVKVIGNHPFYINGVRIEPIEVLHGKKPIFGYRIGKFAYVTDAKTIDDREIDKLNNLDVLIVNALRPREHFAHFSIDEALKLIDEVKPHRAYLTHFNHEIGRHYEFARTLPENVYPAYDGLTITI